MRGHGGGSNQSNTSLTVTRQLMPGRITLQYPLQVALAVKLPLRRTVMQMPHAFCTPPPAQIGPFEPFGLPCRGAPADEPPIACHVANQQISNPLKPTTGLVRPFDNCHHSFTSASPRLVIHL